MKAGPGQQKRLQFEGRIMQESHKNFFAEGTKVQTFSQKECDFLIMFSQLKEVMQVDSPFLFAQPREDYSTLTYDIQKQRMKNWRRDILKLFGFRDKIDWKATIHRQLCASIERNINLNPTQREALLRARGHQAKTAELF